MLRARCVLAVCFGLTATLCQPCDPDAFSVQPGTGAIVDGCARQRFFRGANVVSKLPPFVPPTSPFNPETSFAQEDATLLRSMGWNLIRLGTMWPGVMPQSAQIDETYLQQLVQVSTIAAGSGIYSLLDAHQDTLSNQFCGEGMPAWIAKIAANTSQAFPMPVLNHSFVPGPDGLPTDQDCGTVDWTALYFSSAVGTAFQNLYAANGDTFGVRALFQQFWAAIVKAYASAPAVSPSGSAGVAKSLYSSAVLMTEVLNEPWAGDVVRHPWLIVPGVADRENLQPFYGNVSAAIRAAEPTGKARRLISYESVTYDDFIATGFYALPGSNEGLAVLNFHYYSLPNFNVGWQFAARAKDAQRLSTGMILSEFDLGDQNLTAITETIDMADSYRTSWTGWEYKTSFITGADQSFWNSDGTINTERARVMARPGPNAVGGTTNSYSFNSNTATFTLSYTLTKEAIQAVPQLGTTVYLPTGLWYGCSTGCSNATTIDEGVIGGMEITVTSSVAAAVTWKLEETPGAVIPESLDYNRDYAMRQLYGDRTYDPGDAPFPFAYATLTLVPSAIDDSLAGTTVNVQVRRVAQE